MAQEVHRRSRDEQEFWDRRFDDPVEPVPRGHPAWPLEDRVHEHPPTHIPPSDPRDSWPHIPRPAVRSPESGWRRALEWVRDRRGDPRLGVVALVAVAVVAGFVWYRVGLAGGGDVPPPPARERSATTDDQSSNAAAPGTPTPSAPSSGTRPDGSRAAVMVHVAGAIVRPGVVELPHGARVVDALEAVGGATLEADVDRLNLAAPVVDGARVYVPKRGEADPGVLNGGTSADLDAAPTPGAKLNLNTATEEQLDDLPGIGPVYAQAIIAERTRRGGFRSVNELREVRGIGDVRFADLAPLVTV